jgi:hypothetical protein
MSLGNSKVLSWPFNIYYPLPFSNDCWIVIGFGLYCIVNPFWKSDLDLDCPSHVCDGFGLDWQSKIIGLRNGRLICIREYQSVIGNLDCTLVKDYYFCVTFDHFSNDQKKFGYVIFYDLYCILATFSILPQHLFIVIQQNWRWSNLEHVVTRLNKPSKLQLKNFHLSQLHPIFCGRFFVKEKASKNRFLIANIVRYVL